MKPIKRIALATDFSESSNRAEELAISLKERFEGELHLIHVFDPSSFEMPAPYFFMPGADTWLNSRLISLKAKGETHLEEHGKKIGSCVTKLLEGKPGREIVAYLEANDIDMLVMGSHGHSTLERWVVGSVTEYVIHHTKVPVLLAKQ